jgi:hypothetical protein
MGMTAYRRRAPATTQSKFSETYFSDFVDPKGRRL